MDYKFKEPKSANCLVCFCVQAKERQILTVCNNKQKSIWEFYCDKKTHDKWSFTLASMEQVTHWDKTVNELFDLPPGYFAERKYVGGTWQKFERYY